MKVEDEENKNRIIGCLSDPQCRRIIDLTVNKPLSASDIAEGCNLPPSSAYRRISTLTDAGLLGVERSVITEDGKKYDLFRSTIKGVEINYRPSDIMVRLIPNEDMISKFIRIWAYMKKGIEASA